MIFIMKLLPEKGGRRAFFIVFLQVQCQTISENDHKIAEKKIKNLKLRTWNTIRILILPKNHGKYFNFAFLCLFVISRVQNEWH